MSIPAVRSIASVTLESVCGGDYSAEFKHRKTECVQLCYKALELLSGFHIPDFVPVQVASIDSKATVGVLIVGDVNFICQSSLTT